MTTNFRDGGTGAAELAEAVVEAAEEPSDFHFLYPSEAPCARRSRPSPRRVYGADGVDFLPAAGRRLDLLRGERLRGPADLHRQDPPVDLLGPEPEGRTDRVAPSGPGGSGVGRCRVRLRHLR